MTKTWYTHGNVYKVKYRGEHWCYKCKTPLSIVEHSRIIEHKTEETEQFFVYHETKVGAGPYEFIHNVFYCPRCLEYIEFYTQISLEDVDILIKKVEKKFNKKNKRVKIDKKYETNAGVLEDKIKKIENVKNMFLFITGENKEMLVYKIPLLRKDLWERPYYFYASKKELINYIKSMWSK